jgi:excisionase family DNA binding protein
MKKPQNAQFETLPDVLNIHQFRAVLGIGKKTAYTLIKEKKVKAFMVSNSYRIPKSSLIEYIKKEVNKK